MEIGKIGFDLVSTGYLKTDLGFVGYYGTSLWMEKCQQARLCPELAIDDARIAAMAFLGQQKIGA